MSFPGPARAGSAAERSSAARRRRGEAGAGRLRGRGPPESRSPRPRAQQAQQWPPPGPPPGGAGPRGAAGAGGPGRAGSNASFVARLPRPRLERELSHARRLGAWPRGPKQSVPLLRLACLTRPLKGQKPGDGGCYSTEPFTGSPQRSLSPEQEPLSTSLPLGCPSKGILILRFETELGVTGSRKVPLELYPHLPELCGAG